MHCIIPFHNFSYKSKAIFVSLTASFKSENIVLQYKNLQTVEVNANFKWHEKHVGKVLQVEKIC